MFGIGRKPSPTKDHTLVARHTLVIRVAGTELACTEFLSKILRLITVTFNCRVKYDRYDGPDVVVTTNKENSV